MLFYLIFIYFIKIMLSLTRSRKVPNLISFYTWYLRLEATTTTTPAIIDICHY